jgi:hypothetical protein
VLMLGGTVGNIGTSSPDPPPHPPRSAARPRATPR